MIKRLREKLRLIWKYGWATRKFEWPPARVIRRAWPQRPPGFNEVGLWHFACGDCRVIFAAEVENRRPDSFHPECPGCAAKARAWLEGKAP